jgi:hypothetical protein
MNRELLAKAEGQERSWRVVPEAYQADRTVENQGGGRGVGEIGEERHR